MLNKNHLLYGSTIFLGALLFTIQPMFSKGLLPIFGGSGFVWISSILFYQIILLFGYLYAAFTVSYLGPRKQVILHLLLLAISLLFIPISIKTFLDIEGIWLPFKVILFLSSSLLLPFLMISSTSSLLSRWFYAIDKDTFVYKLYALSSLGCLIGVLGYPLLIESWLGLKNQLLIWSCGYILFVVMNVICAMIFARFGHEVHEEGADTPITFALFAKWCAYAFLASALLYAVTQYLIQNAINLPLMWVLPFGLFLIAYVVVFSRPKEYERLFWGISYLIWITLLAWLIYKSKWSGLFVVVVLLALLYCGCMVCLGELFKIRPHGQRLTHYYAAIALGGVLGGAFIHASIFIFNQTWDFYIVLLIIIGIVVHGFYQSWSNTNSIWYASVGSLGFLCVLFFVYATGNELLRNGKAHLVRVRNEYGLIQVKEHTFSLPQFNYRIIQHGKILHGMQFTQPYRNREVTSYYGPTSGVGLAVKFLKLQNKPIKIGVIGLGAGTFAAWGAPGDKVRFYEIDKDVVKIAKKYFTFLRDSRAKVEVTIGDARIVMEDELKQNGSQQYDLIVIDAFGGDAIPFHVITQEALQLYQKHLKPNGIIAFHTSNTYLDLYPVTSALAQSMNCSHYWLYSQRNLDLGWYNTTWALITCNPLFAQYLRLVPIQSEERGTKPRLWTDDYNTILPLIKWQTL